MFIQSGPMSRPQTLGERFSKLPVELILQVLESALVLLGPVSKKDFWAGKCEWPGCLCENSDWEHVPGEELTNRTLLPWLLAPQPIPRLAQFVFYRSNAFRVCDPRSEMDWPPGNGVWLPPQHARQWIQRLEIQYLIESPPAYPPVHGPLEFKRDVLMLRQIRRAVDRFTKLRTLKLMFEAAFVISDDRLETLDHIWGTLEHFHFQTPKLIMEACSPYPEGRDDVQEGDLARDERLEKVLTKHMSATGMMNRIDEKRE
ncbi:hypothetical protein E8E11_006330 [Didymella keratinophila]|nr:hypothetical protein E8E11_006330 [Didymella keratinophila]